MKEKIQETAYGLLVCAAGITFLYLCAIIGG
jgi:hypothetical protein